jgi:hypothetical protein
MDNINNFDGNPDKRLSWDDRYITAIQFSVMDTHMLYRALAGQF